MTTTRKGFLATVGALIAAPFLKKEEPELPTMLTLDPKDYNNWPCEWVRNANCGSSLAHAEKEFRKLQKQFLANQDALKKNGLI